MVILESVAKDPRQNSGCPDSFVERPIRGEEDALTFAPLYEERNVLATSLRVQELFAGEFFLDRERYEFFNLENLGNLD